MIYANSFYHNLIIYANSKNHLSHLQTKVICFFFLSGIPSSLISPSTNPRLQSLTLVNFYLITPSTSDMNFWVVYSDHQPSLSDIWFKFITSIDKFEIVLRRFLLKAQANYPFEAFLTLITSSVQCIFCLRISIMPWYWS